jgi:hypothetical protein
MSGGDQAAAVEGPEGFVAVVVDVSQMLDGDS